MIFESCTKFTQIMFSEKKKFVCNTKFEHMMTTLNNSANGNYLQIQKNCKPRT